MTKRECLVHGLSRTTYPRLRPLVNGDGVLRGLTEKGGSVKREDLTPQRDFCPKSPDGKHRLCDYSYWGDRHPRCDRCEYLDTEREV